jgi:hypothetical protein
MPLGWQTVNTCSGRRRATCAVAGREARRWLVAVEEEVMTACTGANFQCAGTGVRPHGSGRSRHGAVPGWQDMGVAASGHRGRGEVQVEAIID